MDVFEIQAKLLMEIADMKSKIIHIIIAYVFHIVFIVMSSVMMQQNYDALQMAYIILGVVYLVYWVICNRKSYMPWDVYIHFVVGALVQFFLNKCGVIPADGGFFPGLGQFAYAVFVAIHAVLIGLANLILYVIYKKRFCGKKS